MNRKRAIIFVGKRSSGLFPRGSKMLIMGITGIARTRRGFTSKLETRKTFRLISETRRLFSSRERCAKENSLFCLKFVKAVKLADEFNKPPVEKTIFSDTFHFNGQFFLQRCHISQHGFLCFFFINKENCGTQLCNIPRRRDISKICAPYLDLGLRRQELTRRLPAPLPH